MTRAVLASLLAILFLAACASDDAPTRPDDPPPPPGDWVRDRAATPSPGGVLLMSDEISEEEAGAILGEGAKPAEEEESESR